MTMPDAQHTNFTEIGGAASDCRRLRHGSSRAASRNLQRCATGCSGQSCGPPPRLAPLRDSRTLLFPCRVVGLDYVGVGVRLGVARLAVALCWLNMRDGSPP